MKNKRFVFDTNVLISALFSKTSIPFQSVKIAEQQGFILYSEETLLELNQVLNRKKFDKYITLEERQIFIAKYITSSELVTIKKIVVCRDVKDNKFLELAVSGNADIIITGDQDLLVLNPFQNIKITTPENFSNS
jgi:putative PIN family toxin of toxin-antitoxin system